MTGLSAAMPLPGKTGVVSIMGQNLALSPQSYAMGEIGSMKPGQGAVNLTNPARTAIVMTPADFNANKPALAAMGADVNNTRLGQTLEMNPTIMDVMVTFPSGNQAGGPPKLKAIDNQFNATGPLKNDFASRGKADTAQVANLVVGFGGQAPEGWESVSSRGVMVAAGKFDPASNTSSTGLLSVGVGNPLKLSNSFVLARPGAIDVGRNIARLTTPSASVVVLSAKDFDANRNPLRQMGVNVASVKATFDAGASHVMIDLRPGSATPVQPISFGSGQQGLQRVAQVSDELRQMR